ncbi:MAG: DUF1854 domain-containing protein [Chloroflexota bacterium]|nr:DUF1854 domain-containing protein [Chloroflexota bacterium]
MDKKSLEVEYLDPQKVHFHRKGDTLSMTLDGEYYPRVELRRCFPLAEGTRYLSVRDATTEDHEEIGILYDWTALDESDRQAVGTEMRLFYFVPHIERVVEIKKEFGFLYWEVETDKGELDFVMRDRVTHYTRQVSKNRWMLIDVNKARFEIPDLTALDNRSQRLVRRFLRL